MKYGLITIDQPKGNLGNRLIEHAITTLLDIPKPHVSYSMFSIPDNKAIARLNSCDFVLLPGSTILAKAPRNSDAMAILPKINVPKICISASGWGPRFKYYTEVIKYITPPIGCRDPETVSVCKKCGIPATFVGCPTAYFDPLDLTPEGYTILGFARDLVNWQINMFNRLPGKKVIAIQENKFSRKFAKNVTSHIFDYGNPSIALRQYSRSSRVFTGRLHGILPAMSQRKPVLFFGDNNDSRFSLLKYFGIKINPIGKNFPLKYCTPDVYVTYLEEIKNSFFTWARSFDLFPRSQT